MQVELAHSTSLKEVENFDKNALKTVDTVEKNPLPDADGQFFFYQIVVKLYSCLFSLQLRRISVHYRSRKTAKA